MHGGGTLKNLYRQKVGRWGEGVACEYLAAMGCSVKARNVRTPEGEIDLVVEMDGETRFIEVKARTSRKFGYPEEAITLTKYEHMSAAAESYLSGLNAISCPWHLDVIAIFGKPGSTEMEIEWFKDVDVE